MADRGSVTLWTLIQAVDHLDEIRASLFGGQIFDQNTSAFIRQKISNLQGKCPDGRGISIS
jgi:hypothetical protein